MDNFAVLILTYERPDNIITINTLRKAGYTGKIYIIVDSDDKTLSKYQEKYDNVIIMDKNKYKDKFDIADNFNSMRGVVYARNATFDIAEELGLDYFLVLDDDYRSFNYRFDNRLNYDIQAHVIKRNLDDIFKIILDYYKTIDAKSITLSQGGDFIGGQYGGLADKLKIKRKIMNSFFCSPKRRFTFDGRINEDVNAYVKHGQKGELMFQLNQLCIEQGRTQANKGGLTDIYLDNGTYIKSFYSILFSPSSVKIILMGNVCKRLHHFIEWNKTVPKIISDKYRLPNS